MPEPSPALVDTIASALANATAPGATEWWETITGVHGSQHEQPQQVDDYRRMARAALAAMPQPVGYAAIGTFRDDDCEMYEGTIYGPGTYDECVRRIGWASRSMDPPADPRVVALVPVEQP